jgi:hypothetical protein
VHQLSQLAELSGFQGGPDFRPGIAIGLIKSIHDADKYGIVEIQIFDGAADMQAGKLIGQPHPAGAIGKSAVGLHLPRRLARLRLAPG